MEFVLPAELLDSLKGVDGFERDSFIGAHEEGTQIVSIRFNPGKMGEPVFPVPGADACAEETGSSMIAPGPGAFLRQVPWSSRGFYLPKRPSFTFDPFFHAGVYYVQEASSMFLGQALRQTVNLSQSLRVLDLCAAPGGKSTLLQSLISPESLLISNEVIRSRAGILEENMIKWGGANSIITQNDPRDFGRLENYFDVIVVDAPCSGSGLFRRDPEAIAEWSLSNVQLCSERQQRILADCWPALKPGGILIYSTCSYSREEDEEILDWIKRQLDAGTVSRRLALEEDWNIVEVQTNKGAYGYRFYPDRLDGEGFFIACLQKDGDTSFSAHKPSQHTPSRGKHGSGKAVNTEKLSRQETESVGNWIHQDAEKPFYFFRHGDLIHLLPDGMAGDLSFLRSNLYLRKAGLTLGQAGNREFIPEHALAMSPLASKRIPSIALSLEDALRYLRKDELPMEVLPSNLKKGWALVQYEGCSLGWVKVLPNRINNYYPKDWRILKR